MFSPAVENIDSPKASESPCEIGIYPVSASDEHGGAEGAAISNDSAEVAAG